MSQAFLDAAESRPRRAALWIIPHPISLFVHGLAERVPRDAARFLVVGGMSSTVNWLVRFPLSVVLPYGAAVALAYAIGMVAGFGLYRSWVFPGSSLTLRSQILRFILVNIAGFACVIAGAEVIVFVLAGTGLLSLSLAEAIGHGAAIALGAGFNFLGHRAVTFARGALAPRVIASSFTGWRSVRVAVESLAR